MTPKEIGQKWTEKTGQSFFKNFVTYFSTYELFKEWLREKGLDPEKEDRSGHLEWYPEGELWEVGNFFGIELEDDEENGQNYWDFFNELSENNW